VVDLFREIVQAFNEPEFLVLLPSLPVLFFHSVHLIGT
jgi:hypothetical protein